MSSITINPTTASATRRWLTAADSALVLVAIALVFVVHSGGQVPEPNEPYYLAKARHYWDPGWIADDYFLESADSHWVFYGTLGWLARWMPLVAVAWTGRWLTWALLSVAWQRLSYAIAPRFGLAALSAAAMVCLNEGTHMAGEWVVGGFEAKGIAYALVIAALGEVVRNRWNSAWLLLGAASAFHVLVGGWSTVAALLCWISSGEGRVSLRSMLPGLIGGFGLALFGLAPALALTRGATSAVTMEANHIYVFHRLAHHLYFFEFPGPFIARHTLLLAVWIALCLVVGADDGRWRLRRIVAAAVLLAVVGMALSWWATFQPARAVGWLRFYWFRLSDVMLPVGVALEAAAVLAGTSYVAYKPEARARGGWTDPSLALRVSVSRPNESGYAQWFAVGVAVMVVYLVSHALVAPPSRVPRADKPGKVTNYDDWLAACQWIFENTPVDARFLTPRSGQTFKWYAGRGEVATWKDIPQDAASIVEWWDRLKEIHAEDPSVGDPVWRDSLTEAGAARLKELGTRYGAGFVLTDAQPEIELPCVYRNNTYAVYALPLMTSDSDPRR